MERISRRSFFKVAGATVAATAAEARALTGPTASPSSSIPSTTYTFLNPDEARFIEAAVERLIPVDENGPGAIDASVPNYLAKQLAGGWGAGERLYRGDPWHEGALTQGYQLSFTPAELFRNALRGITNDLQKRGVASFAKLDPKDQDAYPTGLRTNTINLNGVPSNVFFESLLSLTIEGFSPIRSMAATTIWWRAR